MRACSQCESTTNGFNKCPRVKDGFMAECKVCHRARFKTYSQRSEVVAQRKLKSAEWNKQNPDKSLAKTKRYQKLYPERVAISQRSYVERNRERCRAKVNARVRHIRMPLWANKIRVRSVYLVAQEKSRISGRQFVVDHVIPIKHKLVCGLHVENNLRVILETDNSSKANSFNPNHSELFRSMI